MFPRASLRGRFSVVSPPAVPVSMVSFTVLARFPRTDADVSIAFELSSTCCFFVAPIAANRVRIAALVLFLW